MLYGENAGLLVTLLKWLDAWRLEWECTLASVWFNSPDIFWHGYT